jgi:hypothetical protein
VVIRVHQSALRGARSSRVISAATAPLHAVQIDRIRDAGDNLQYDGGATVARAGADDQTHSGAPCRAQNLTR